ncbi:MAG TPA: aspartate-semialdehyde dehydrogenase, partial [Actinomycetota bacterium]|nr:aspartate-semialdehyde dehydrogenase [Actinomycetota bacterium]
MRVAVVGATGAVGRTMVRILEERGFPLDELIPLASQRTAGTRLTFRDEELTTGLLSDDALEDVDIALSSCGSSVAKEWTPGAAARGTVC